jgi:hypothetical protein
VSIVIILGLHSCTRHAVAVHRNSKINKKPSSSSRTHTTTPTRRSPKKIQHPRLNFRFSFSTQISEQTATMSLLEPPQELLALLHESLPDSITATNDADTTGTEDILAYVAFLAAGLCAVVDFTPKTWTETLKPYFDAIDGGAEIDVDLFRVAAQKTVVDEDDADSYGDAEDDEFEEVCNLRFK